MVTCFKAVAVRMGSGGLEVCLETASAGLAGGLDSGGEGGRSAAVSGRGSRGWRGTEARWDVGQRAWDRGVVAKFRVPVCCMRGILRDVRAEPVRRKGRRGSGITEAA